MALSTVRMSFRLVCERFKPNTAGFHLPPATGTFFFFFLILFDYQTDAGASENYLRNAFKTLLSRHKASILILDEVDMIASGRASRKGSSRVLHTL